MSINMLDLLTEVNEALPTNDLLITGGNLRLVAGGSSTFPVEEMTGYIDIPAGALRLLRVQVNTQPSGMDVLRMELALEGETIGLLGESDSKTPLPLFTAACFTRWRTYLHRFHTECMNPSLEAVEAIKELCLKNGYMEWKPRTTSREYERTSEIIFDLEPGVPGSQTPQIPQRFANAIKLDSAVLIPDERDDVLTTSYVNKDNDTITRPGFTGLFDVLVPAMSAVIKSNAALIDMPKETADEKTARREATENIRTQMQRLAILTGYNPDSSWPLRPTIAYVTPTGGEEIRVIGTGSAPVEETPVSSDPTPVAPADVDPLASDPFTED